MATTETSVLLRGQDGAGNINLYYPVTTAENVVGLDDKHGFWEVSVPASGWTGDGPYYQEIAVSGILASDCPHWGICVVSDLYEELAAYQLIDLLVTYDGQIALVCPNDYPDIDLTLHLEVNR